MSTRRLIPGFIAPGLVLTLIAVQIAFGVRGFDNPKGGFAAVLELPGVIAGWGGILFLFPVLVWLVLDWWGFAPSSFALRALGAGALALAAGSLFALFGGEAFGGSVGAGLAALLEDTVGFPIAICVLAAMAVPGLILAFAGFGGAGGAKRPAPKPVLQQTPAQSDAVVERKPLFGFMRPKKKVSNLADLVRDAPKAKRKPGEPWYPSQQFSEEGDEVPMDFDGARDVGGIRFVDDPEPEDVVEEAAPDSETALEDEADAIEPEEEPEGRLHVDGNGAEVVVAEVVGAPAVEPETVGDAPAPFDLDPVDDDEEPAPAPKRKPDASWDKLEDEAEDEPLPPGVRYAEPAPAAQAPAPDTSDNGEGEESVEALDDEDEALHELMRGTPPAAQPPIHTSREVRESMRNTLLPEQMQEASRRYLKKLESSGIFDFLEEDEEPAAKKPAAKRKKAAKKPAAKKKKAAKKKAARKPAAKRSAKKSAKKKAAKKSARRKTAARRTTAPKKAPDKGAPSKHRFQATGESSEEIAASLGISVDMHRRLSRESVEPLFAQAVEIALERGAASPVLLTRRMGIGFTGAKKLVQRLVEAGVLGDMNVNGSHPTRLTREVWEHVT